MYYDAATETASKDKIEEIQWQKLIDMLKKVYQNNLFYQRSFNEHGITPGDIHDLGDIIKLPFTTKQDFQKDQERNPVFGTNLTEPFENYVQFHQTTGTYNGQRKPDKKMTSYKVWSMYN